MQRARWTMRQVGREHQADDLVHPVGAAAPRALVEAVEVLRGPRVLVDLRLHLLLATRPFGLRYSSAQPRARSSARRHSVSRDLALVRRERRLVAGGLPPHRAHVLLAPEPGGHAGQVGGAERGGLRDLRHDHGHAEHVGLEAASATSCAPPRRRPSAPRASPRRPPPSPGRRPRSGRPSTRARRGPGGRGRVPRVRPTIVPRA